MRLGCLGVEVCHSVRTAVAPAGSTGAAKAALAETTGGAIGGLLREFGLGLLLDLFNLARQLRLIAKKVRVEHGAVGRSLAAKAGETVPADSANKAGVFEPGEEDGHDSVDELFAIVNLEGSTIGTPADNI